MPSWASFVATARPIPLVPPVISAVDVLAAMGNSPLQMVVEWFATVVCNPEYVTAAVAEAPTTMSRTGNV
jgi:hypothetical protein